MAAPNLELCSGDCPSLQTADDKPATNMSQSGVTSGHPFGDTKFGDISCKPDVKPDEIQDQNEDSRVEENDGCDEENLIEGNSESSSEFYDARTSNSAASSSCSSTSTSSNHSDSDTSTASIDSLDSTIGWPMDIQKRVELIQRYLINYVDTCHSSCESQCCLENNKGKIYYSQALQGKVTNLRYPTRSPDSHQTMSVSPDVTKECKLEDEKLVHRKETLRHGVEVTEYRAYLEIVKVRENLSFLEIDEMFKRIAQLRSRILKDDLSGIEKNLNSLHRRNVEYGKAWIQVVKALEGSILVDQHRKPSVNENVYVDKFVYENFLRDLIVEIAHWGSRRQRDYDKTYKILRTRGTVHTKICSPIPEKKQKELLQMLQWVENLNTAMKILERRYYSWLYVRVRNDESSPVWDKSNQLKTVIEMHRQHEYVINCFEERSPVREGVDVPVIFYLMAREFDKELAAELGNMIDEIYIRQKELEKLALALFHQCDNFDLSMEVNMSRTISERIEISGMVLDIIFQILTGSNRDCGSTKEERLKEHMKSKIHDDPGFALQCLTYAEDEVFGWGSHIIGLSLHYPFLAETVTMLLWRIGSGSDTDSETESETNPDKDPETDPESDGSKTDSKEDIKETDISLNVLEDNTDSLPSYIFM